MTTNPENHDDPAEEAPAVNEEAPPEPANAAEQPAEEKPEEAPSVYKPEGLPDHMLGKDEKETLDKLFKAYKGARDELAGKSPLPEKLEDYTIELAEEDARRFLNPGEDGVDPVFEVFRKSAYEQGIPAEKAAKFVKNVYEEITATAAEENKKMDASFETFGGEAKAKAVIDANAAWISALENQGVLSKEEADDMKLHTQYGAGLRWIDKIRQSLGGEKAIPVNLDGDPQSGKMTEAELHAMMKDERYWKTKDKAYVEKVTKKFQEFYGSA